MTSTVVLVVAAWAITVPAVLGLARLLGRLSAAAAPPRVEAPPQPADNVVPLAPRPRNGLVALHRAA
ncbi:MAG TPA: hypothetical protein VGW75_18350 [Solirubrobacteraceae bacterium]|jgi:hypothetical protein|nr:hypothetical protein [Solirubrobacteraceae bacterium]